MTLRHILLYLLAACLFAACGDDEQTASSASLSVNKNANDASANADLARIEVPHTKKDNIFIPHRTSDGLMNYCLEYNLQANHAQWVAYRYDTKLASKAAPNRTDAWAPEPALNTYKEHQLASHLSNGQQQYFSGYNRGHIIGSAERYYSRQANEQTFYMSNMSPMIGQFNSRYWGTVEDVVRDEWGRKIASGDTLYVVKGGTLDQTIESIKLVNTAGGTLSMAVPKYYFMALLWHRSNTYQAIGFYMEHKDYKNPSDIFMSQLARSSACSIDELEEKTGLDFFCNLPDQIEELVEKKYNINLWPNI